MADWQAEIEKQIPRIVNLLAEPDSRDLVRSAFASVLQKMTPADLLVALHNEETGLKQTIEGGHTNLNLHCVGWVADSQQSAFVSA